MRRIMALLAGLALTACAHGQGAGGPQTVVELDGVPVKVSWDGEARSRASARVGPGDAGADVDLREAVIRGTGCSIAAPPDMRLIVYRDGGRGIEISTDCSRAPKPGSVDRVASRRLAEEIERGVAEVQAAGVPQLYEGSPLGAFSQEQIAWFCEQDWRERIAQDGRTEYNPCHRREMFR